MLSKYVRKKDDCGCGGGKYNCISKNTFAKILQAELKRLDCGCGCKGVKGFKKKYGLKGGAQILADCPPGWRNDGLTCVENCNPDERDDGLTCRKRCPEGQIDDGLTCRVPIKSSMNECPPGSRDIAGTCWGPVRQDCIDDCFKHPAPGCKTYECGRLKGLFGEDWGPRLCTDCNLRCGQTCWDVQGITKQLHQRELRLWGGEVYGQTIRGKQIRGRVNFDALMKEVGKGLTDLFEGRIDLAAAFDPERNGVAAAFRKFGDDIKRVAEEVGSKIKEGFDKMGAETKRAFEEFARNAERDFKQFGEDFVNKMKDPDFWVEAIGIMAQIAAAAVSIAITVGTLGAGTGLAIGIMAAAQMAGPAAKMIADAARGRPIDALDIAQIAIAGATAFIPGMSATVGPMVKAGLNAASYTIKAVQTAQVLGIVPSTCIQNCPVEGPNPPIDPLEEEPKTDPAPGQKTDEEILALAPPCTFFRVIGKASLEAPCNVPPRVTRNGPPYYTEQQWIKKYRDENYGPGASDKGTQETPSGAVVSKEDAKIDAAAKTIPPREDIRITDVVVPPPATDLASADLGLAGPPPCKFKENIEPKNIITPEEIAAADEFGDLEGEFELEEEDDLGNLKLEPEGEVGELEAEDDLDFGELEAEGEIGELEAEDDLGDLKLEAEDDLDFGELEAEDDLDFGELEPEDDVGGSSVRPAFYYKLSEKGKKEYEDALEKRNQRGYGKRRGGAELGAALEPIMVNGVLTNPGGTMVTESTSSKLKKIPKDHTEAEFNLGCYLRNNPEIGAELGNDQEKVTLHWIDIGSKQGYDASCDTARISREERMRIMEDRLKKEALSEGLRTACKAADRFWTESTLTCDGTRNGDGSVNTFAEECKKKNSYWDTEGQKSFCNVFKDTSGNIKSDKERCNTLNNYWDGSKCIISRNVDGNYKSMADVCSGLNIFYDGSNCNITKDSNGEIKDYKKECDKLSGLYSGVKFDFWSANWGNGTDNIDVTEYIKGKIRFARDGEDNNGYKMNSNQLIIPGFDFENDWRTKFNSKDPAPGKKKYFLISWWTSTTGPTGYGSDNSNEASQFTCRTLVLVDTALKPIKDGYDPNSCNLEIFPDGRYKGKEYIEKVDGGLLKPEDAGFNINRPPGDLGMMGRYLQTIVYSPEFQENKDKAKQTSDIEPPRGSGRDGCPPLDMFKYMNDPAYKKQWNEACPSAAKSGKGIGGKSLTLYWANGCPHCHNMMPEWNKLGKTHKGIQIIAIERMQNKSFPVNAYPTIIFRNGKKMEKYEGPRTKSGFVKFLKNKL